MKQTPKLLGKESGESIAKYFTRVQTLTNRMQIFGETMTDQSIVEKVLHYVSAHFDHIVVAIEESKHMSKG